VSVEFETLWFLASCSWEKILKQAISLQHLPVRMLQTRHICTRSSSCLNFPSGTEPMQALHWSSSCVEAVYPIPSLFSPTQFTWN